MDNKTTTSGVSVLTVIQTVFIILKLTNLINWSWVTVLIPLWIDLFFIFIILIAILIYRLIDK